MNAQISQHASQLNIDATPFVSVEPGFYLLAVHQSMSLSGDPDDVRAKIYALEAEVAKLPQVDLPLEHHFADGVYVRTMFIPKGTCLTGKVHRFDCVNIVHGDISVVTEGGSKRITALCAPQRFSSPAGVKRAGYAHEDTYWTTVHANPGNETDVLILEDALTVFDGLIGQDPQKLERIEV